MEYRRANTDWMRGNFGISVHWTALSRYLDGSMGSYEEAVDAFDTERFADALEYAGARHCIFTLAHAKQYLPCPNAVLEEIMPGRTCRRDMLGDLIASLSRRGIKLIAYYNHACNGRDDLEYKAACGYADGPEHALDRFARNYCGIVGWMAKRYGDGISAWWFDSGYSVDRSGPHCTVTCDMAGWQFPWEKLVEAAKSGYSDVAVCVNAGIGQNYLYTPYQDYYAGETVRLDEVFTPPAIPEMADHRWTCIDSTRWVFDQELAASGFVPPRFQDAELKAFTKMHLAAGRMVTFNILIDRSGILNPLALEQARRIAK